jgi:hypothetical protein
LNLRAYVTFIVDLFRTYRPPSLTSTRDGYHLGSVQRSLLYRPPRFPEGGSWTHLPFTVLVLRRNLDSVTSLADTLKTWLHCIKVVHISLRYHSSGGVKVRGPD